MEIAGNCPPNHQLGTLELEGHGVRIPRHVPILGIRILQRKPDERHARILAILIQPIRWLRWMVFCNVFVPWLQVLG